MKKFNAAARLYYPKLILLIFLSLILKIEIFGQDYKFVNPSSTITGGAWETSSLTSDNRGNFYFIIKFKGKIKFLGKEFISYDNPYSISYSDEDLLLIKIDSEGNLLWANQIGSIDRSSFGKINVDKDGNVVLFTTLDETKYLINNIPSPLNGAVLAKFLSKDGTLIWITTCKLKASAITFDSFNNIYIAGSFSDVGIIDTIQIDASNKGTRNTSSDLFIAKLTPNGKAVWISRAGTKLGQSLHNLYLTASDISINSKGDIFVTCQADYYSGDANIFFDSIPILLKKSDGYVVQLNNQGKFTLVQANFKKISNIEIDLNDNIFISGIFTYGISNDYFSLPNDNNNASAYIAKISPSLKINWVNKIKGQSYLSLNDLDVDKLGNIYLLGEFENSLIIGNNFLSTALQINFIYKANSNGVFQNLNKIPTTVHSHSSLSVNSNGLIGFLGRVDGIKSFGNFFVDTRNANYEVVVGAFSLTTEEVPSENINSVKTEVPNIYPNPASVGISIKVPNSLENLELLIYNQLGVLIRSENFINEKEYFIDLLSIPQGLYMIKLISPTNIVSQKLDIRR